MDLPLIGMLGLGLLMAVTPCMWPLYPILLSVISKDSSQRLHSMVRTFWFVQGVAIAYTLVGWGLSVIGVAVQAWMQQGFVLILSALILFVLGLSMLGVINLGLPGRWVDAINKKTDIGPTRFLFPFVVGLGAGLTLSPCTTAPLAAAVMYVVSAGEQGWGVLSFYVLGIGAGLPMFLIAFVRQGVLPKTGRWSVFIKHIIGYALLFTAVAVLTRYSLIAALLYPFVSAYVAWAVLAFWCPDRTRWLRVLAVLITFAAYGFYVSEMKHAESVDFVPMSNPQAVQDVIESEDVIMVDLYADWCSVCKAFDRNVFVEKEVVEMSKSFAPIKLDMTSMGPQHQAFAKRHGVLGVPAIMFFVDGQELKEFRVEGYLDAEQLTARMEKILDKVAKGSK